MANDGGTPAASATKAELLAAFLSSLDPAAVPDDVLHGATLRLLEVVGLAAAGGTRPSGRMVAEMLLEEAGAGDSSVIGFARRAPAPAAALANGAMADCLEYGDAHRSREGVSTGLHPALCIAPAALAVAETGRRDGSLLAVAIVAGLEVAVRVARVVPHGFFRRGFHTTALCSVFGAAAAAGVLLRLDSRQLANALGICLSFASGTMEYTADGSWAKQLHVGWQAQAGITAAHLARRGFTGPRTVFEGGMGLFRSHIDADSFDFDALTRGLGDVWETRAVISRMYPLGNLSGAFIEAAAALRERHRPALDDIEAIECDVWSGAVPLVCEPLALKRRPPTAYGAKYSLPYAVGLAMAHGAITPQHFFEECFPDQRALGLAARVSYTANPDRFSESGLVRLRLRDGRTVEHEVPYKKGSLQNPVTEDEVRQKFRTNARIRFSDERTATIERQVMDLPRVADVRDQLGPLFMAEA